MKQLTTLFFVFVTTLSYAFEGSFSYFYWYSESAEPWVITWNIKGDKVLLQMSGKLEESEMNLNLLPNLEEGALYMYSKIQSETGENFYHRIPVENVKPKGQEEEKIKKKEIESENGKTTISGLLFKQDISLTLANEPALDLAKYSPFFRDYPEILIMAVANLKGIPTEFTQTAKDGTLIRKTKLISSETKEMADSIFEIPAGYKDVETLH